MLGSGNDRIYNMISLVFVTLSTLWVIYVIIQLAAG